MNLSEREIDRIIEMAWEDRTTFEAIHFQFGLNERQVIKLMRGNLKPKSFRLWRKRVSEGVSQKHASLRNKNIIRFKSSNQRTISQNRISKR